MQTEILATRTWVQARIDGVTDPYAFTVAADGIVIGYDITYGSRVIMPTEVNGVNVTNIAAGTFNSNLEQPNTYAGKAVTLVVGPTTLTNIDDYAFAGCTSLSTLILYGNKPEFGENVFLGIPNGQVTIYRLVGTTGWPATLFTMPVIEVENFTSVLEADRPLYIRDTIDKRLHEIRITASGLNSGLIQ